MLNLRDNLIGSIGAQYLAEALHNNTVTCHSLCLDQIVICALIVDSCESRTHW